MFSQLYTEAEKREHKTKRKIIKRERNKEQGSRKGSTQIKDKAAEEIIYICSTHNPLFSLSHTHTTVFIHSDSENVQCTEARTLKASSVPGQASQHTARTLFTLRAPCEQKYEFMNSWAERRH